MRFCDFFAGYKIRMKGLKCVIPYNKQPRYRMVLMSIFVLALTLFALFFTIETLLPGILNGWYVGIPIIVMVVALIVWVKMDSNPKNMKNLLLETHIPYSKERINSLKELLKEFGVDFSNHTLVDMLIEQARRSKENGDPFIEFGKPCKAIVAIGIPVLGVAGKELVNGMDKVSLSNYCAIFASAMMVVLALSWTFLPTIKSILYSDEKYYDDLIYDLEQIKIFEGARHQEK